MEISTLLGLIAGIGSVGVGMALKGADPHSLVNPAAFLIIFAGTFAAILNAFPLKEIKKFGALFKILFTGKKFMKKQEILELFLEVSQLAKKEGPAAIERKANELKDPFARSSLILVADGFSADFIYEVIESEIKQMEERHRSGALLFAQCGMYAPTLGVLGAVIGLIAALGNLSDIAVLGHSIAAAFVATLLGIFCGYVCWHPFANKLKQLSKEEVEIKRMILQGALSLQARESAIAMEAKMQTFIPLSQRKQMRED